MTDGLWGTAYNNLHRTEREARLRDKIGCRKDGSVAPRGGCTCRACMLAREDAIDAEFVGFIAQLQRKSTPAAAAVMAHVNPYLAGHISLSDMYVETIKALVEQNTKMFDQILAINRLSPVPIVIPNDGGSTPPNLL